MNLPATARTILCFVALALCGAGCDDPPPRAIILITVDTLRADHLSNYGYEVETSPNIAALAAKGRTYAHAFSASSSTAPSHASLMTGLYPSWHTVGSINGVQSLHSNTVTLAEIFAESGYATGAVVSNPVLERSLGLDQGFDFYDDELPGMEANRDRTERYADQAIDMALAWLGSQGESEFFLWVHVQDPHGPYLPPDRHACPAIDGEFAAGPTLAAGEDHSGHQAIPLYQLHADQREFAEYRDRYDCEISFADRELGRLFEWIDAQGPEREILVALTSDHGEAMGEDDFYFSHGHSLGLDQVHVPLILAGPGIEAGETAAVPVTNVALFETLLEFAGLVSPVEGAPSSLLESRDSSTETFYMECLNQVAVVHGNIFLRKDLRGKKDSRFWSEGNPNSGGFWKPLGEEVIAPLSAGLERGEASRDDARRLLTQFVEQAKQAQKANEDLIEGVDLSPEQLEALKSLGYIE